MNKLDITGQSALSFVMINQKIGNDLFWQRHPRGDGNA